MSITIRRLGTERSYPVAAAFDCEIGEFARALLDGADAIVERLVNRYYDPSTDQFLSIDPDVAQTDQPYVFTNDDPLNAEDPLGLCFVICSIAHAVASGFDATRHFVAAHKVLIAQVGLAIVVGVATDGAGDALLLGSEESADEAATSALDGVKLGRQLASEAQMSESGTRIAGAGSDTELRAADQLAETYGGSPEDYAKVRSSSYTGSDGFQFETHSYVNSSTGEILEAKTVFQTSSNLGYK